MKFKVPMDLTTINVIVDANNVTEAINKAQALILENKNFEFVDDDPFLEVFEPECKVSRGTKVYVEDVDVPGYVCHDFDAKKDKMVKITTEEAFGTDEEEKFADFFYLDEINFGK